MSRTKRKEKTKPHCKMVGCEICENIRIKDARNRAYKIEKARGGEEWTKN